MVSIQDFIERLRLGKADEMANLFDLYGVLHDSSPIRVGQDTMHLEGRLAVEMMFHHRFGFMGGGYDIRAVEIKDDSRAWYFILYKGIAVPVTAQIEEWNEEGLIKRINVYPL